MVTVVLSVITGGYVNFRCHWPGVIAAYYNTRRTRPTYLLVRHRWRTNQSTGDWGSYVKSKWTHYPKAYRQCHCLHIGLQLPDTQKAIQHKPHHHRYNSQQQPYPATPWLVNRRCHNDVNLICWAIPWWWIRGAWQEVTFVKAWRANSLPSMVTDNEDQNFCVGGSGNKLRGPTAREKLKAAMGTLWKFTICKFSGCGWTCLEICVVSVGCD